MAVADACDKVLRATPANPIAPKTVPGDDKSLGAFLKDLHPAEVEIASGFQDGTNNVWRVRLFFTGKDQFTVAWENNPTNQSQWELALTGGEGRIVVFTSQKTSAATKRN
jgi:hypothetical protein